MDPTMTSRELALDTALRAILHSLAEGVFHDDAGKVCYVVEADDLALAQAKAIEASSRAARTTHEPVVEVARAAPETVEDYLIEVWRALG